VIPVRRRKRIEIIVACAIAAAVLAVVFGLGASSLLSAPAPGSTSDHAPAKGSAVSLSAAEEAWRLDEDATMSVVPASAVGVIDGDSLVFRLADGKLEEVRLTGLDAPELRYQRDVYGMVSAEQAATLLRRQPKVFLETGPDERDRYGRLLAYVWLEKPNARPSASEVRETMLNARMLTEGYAKLYTRKPNTKYAGLFEAYVKQAAADARGLWDPTVAEEAGPSASWTASLTSDPNTASAPYVGNAISKKFHRATCENALKIRLSSRVPLQTRESAVKAGYVPCRICNP